MEDKIDINEIIDPLLVKDRDAFINYLKDVYTDLYNRITKNKNDPIEKQSTIKGIPKLLFNKYYNLPGIIGDRLFRVFDINNDGVLEIKEFINGMIHLFCGNYEQSLHFIFDFYDFDRNGKINKEDIRVVLSYITLADSPDIKSSGVNLSYNNRVNSQKELYNILSKCFDKNENSEMDFDNFKNIIENKNSDIYLLILLFILENKPFTKKNLDSYIKNSKQSHTKIIITENNSPSKTNLIISQTKTSNFSPYKALIRKNIRRRSSLTDTKIVLKEFEHLDTISNENTQQLQKSIQTYDIGKSKTMVNNLKELKNLHDDNDENNKKINEGKVKELTKKRDNKNQNEELEIKPAFKQNIDIKFKDNNKFNKPQKKIGDEELSLDDDDLDFKNDFDEEPGNNDDGEDELNYEGVLYKYIDEKMRKFWFKLIHKDLYYYRKKDDKNRKGMHNLTGLFFQEEKPKILDGITYYAFSIIYPNRNKIYYCDDKKKYKIWTEKLKKATGYTNLLDLYEVKSKLGNGKFGLVKLGINKKTNEKVAIKIMNKEKMDSSDLELVRTEIEILKICQHPYIIRLYDILENAQHIYIIMEYCKGGDLFSFLEKRKFKISEKLTSQIIHKMCTAVFYIHSYGIAHRDLKPENILMVSEDDESDIRILDFGLSKIISPNEKCTEPYGTLTYCAPEIILGNPYSKAVDLWSIGIMTYLMLSGKLPFNGLDENEVAKAVAFDEPDYKRNDCWKNISKEAVDFVKKLLEKDPTKRMNIKQALEHEWIKKYSKDDLMEIRQGNIENKSNFEIYTSVVKSGK